MSWLTWHEKIHHHLLHQNYLLFHLDCAFSPFCRSQIMSQIEIFKCVTQCRPTSVFSFVDVKFSGFTNLWKKDLWNHSFLILFLFSLFFFSFFIDFDISLQSSYRCGKSFSFTFDNLSCFICAVNFHLHLKK